MKTVSLLLALLLAPPSLALAADADGDGFSSETDCDDADPGAHPGAVEECDGVDNDCDDVVDDGATLRSYRDLDGDGFGDAAWPIDTCEPLEGYVTNGLDCDDGEARVHPGNPEEADGLDNDCDGLVDEGVSGAEAVCDNGNDDDLDGLVDCDDPDCVADPWCTMPHDEDGDGFLEDVDCDDDDRTVHPDATEVCDGQDNDCDGATDEDVLSTWYADADLDGWGDPDQAVEACAAPPGWVTNALDCDDTEPAVGPDAEETCDGVDNDCDGSTDEGCGPADNDGDGWDVESDCNDWDATTHPDVEEECDGRDNNCDGAIDEGCAQDTGTPEVEDTPEDPKGGCGRGGAALLFLLPLGWGRRRARS